MQSTTLKRTVQGLNSHQTIDAQLVELKFTPIHSGGSCPSFVLNPYMKTDLNVGTEVIDIELLQKQYPHIESIPLKKYSYGDIEMILGQNKFHSSHALANFETDRKNTPIAVHFSLGWILSDPLTSTLGPFSTSFKAVTE